MRCCMRIAIDLDGVIAQLKSAEESYAEVKPVPGAVERLKALRAQGHYIIINSARNMATCEANLGRVMKNVGRITLEWLDQHGVEYDEIYFGKPNAEVYLDDRAVRFVEWEKIDEKELSQLPRS